MREIENIVDCIVFYIFSVASFYSMTTCHAVAQTKPVAPGSADAVYAYVQDLIPYS
jgi:hypothetical protein